MVRQDILRISTHHVLQISAFPSNFLARSYLPLKLMSGGEVRRNDGHIKQSISHDREVELDVSEYFVC